MNSRNNKKHWGKFDAEKYIHQEDYTSWKTKNWIAYCWHLRYKPTKMLEAGVLHGLSSIWFMDNILIHPESKWFGVDKELNQSVANFKTAGVPQDKMEFNVGMFGDVLPKLEQRAELFDIVYCDGGKAAGDVYDLVKRCWRILKPNGGLFHGGLQRQWRLRPRGQRNVHN